MKFEDIRKYVKAVLTNSFTNKKTIDKFNENNGVLLFDNKEINSFENKDTLNQLGESEDGNLLFKGEEIKGGGSKQLAELEDVHLTNLTNKNILQYNQTSQKWINTPITNNIIKFPNTAPITKTITPVPKENTVTTLMTFENDCWASVRVRFSTNKGNLVYGIKNEKNQIMFRHRFWAYQHIYSALLYSPPFPVKKGWSIYISDNFYISSISVEYNKCETTESLNIAENIEKWDSTIQYHIGSYCIYNNILWKCKKDNINQIPEEGIYWTNAALSDDMPIHNYSTEPKVVGTWIDGKAVYEQTISLTSPATSNSILYTNNTIDTIVDYNAIVYETADKQHKVPFYYTNTNDTVYYAHIIKNDATSNFMWLSSDIYLSKKVILTIRYTIKSI